MMTHGGLMKLSALTEGVRRGILSCIVAACCSFVVYCPSVRKFLVVISDNIQTYFIPFIAQDGAILSKLRGDTVCAA